MSHSAKTLFICQLSPDHSEIHITSTHESDAGEYSCSVGKAAILSNSIDFQIKGSNFYKESRRPTLLSSKKVDVP